MIEIDNFVSAIKLHRNLVDCRDESGDLLDRVGIKLYKFDEWRDAETQYDSFEDILIGYFHGE
jgi:hypothetical protein